MPLYPRDLPPLRLPPSRSPDSIAAPVFRVQQPLKRATLVFSPTSDEDNSLGGSVRAVKALGVAAAIKAGKRLKIMDHGNGGQHGNHGGMDHGGHGGMDMGGNKCSMNMLWNWDTRGPCIVFESFHVSSPRSLLVAVFLLIIISMLYERLRLYTSVHDSRLRSRLVLGRGGPPSPSSSSLLLDPGPRAGGGSPAGAGSAGVGVKSTGWASLRVPKQDQFVRSLLYTLNVGVSFFIMLVIMTYNGFLIGAILIGAFLGHFTFHRDLTFEAESDSKGLACH